MQELRFLNWTISAVPTHKLMRMRLFGLIIGFALAFECSALELVHLQNGFTLEADSHTEEEGLTVLRVGTGTLSVAKAEIVSIEAVTPIANAAPEKQMVGKPGAGRAACGGCSGLRYRSRVRTKCSQDRVGSPAEGNLPERSNRADAANAFHRRRSPGGS